MIQYLIVCPFVLVARLMDFVVRGDGLIALPAYLIAEVFAHMALGTNKLGSAIGTVVSTIRLAKHGYPKGKMFMAACSTAAALVGSSLDIHLALVVPETVIKHMMILILPTVAFYVFRDKNMGAGKRTGVISDKEVFAIYVLAALLVGGYDGSYGSEAGTFLILILTGTAGLNTRNVSAQTKVINLASNVAALATFIFMGNVSYPLGLMAGVCSIAGHHIGTGAVAHDGQRVVRPVVLPALAVLFVKILSKN